MALLVALLCSIVVRPMQPVSRVDMIELNHCHDEHGSFSFDQLIFWDWHKGEFRCEGWRMAYGCRDKTDEEHRKAWRKKAWDYQNYPGKFVYQPWLPRRVRGRWIMKDPKEERQIESRYFRETWTRYDPERKNRAVFNEGYRRL